MPSQEELANTMLEWLQSCPQIVGLETSDDPKFLFDYAYHFEAARHVIMRDLLLDAGKEPKQEFSILDFGYLSGLTQEFMHRAFPNARFTVFDRPGSPIFEDPSYQAAIKSREYLTLKPLDVVTAQEIPGQYDVIFLGEIIEHLNPTEVARLLKVLRRSAKPSCILLITTPNAASLYNCWAIMSGKEPVVAPPIPDAIHGFGHIHLWSAPILDVTAKHGGWSPQMVKFYHGREGERFSKLRRTWPGLKAYVFVRGIEIVANRKPGLRGCFVAAYKAM